MLKRCSKWKFFVVRGMLVAIVYMVVVSHFYLYFLNEKASFIKSIFLPSQGDVNTSFVPSYNNKQNTNGTPSLVVPLVTVICSENKTKFKRESTEGIYYEDQRQIDQFRVMLGTLLYFSKSPKWRIVVLTDSEETFDKLSTVCKDWPPEQKDRIVLERQPTYVPPGKNYSDLLNKYRPCAWQKIFLEEALPKEEAVVFMDSDILFTGPAEELWKEFSKFNETNFIGLGPEPWYLKDNNRPYAGRVGLNTGVMMLNFTKQRQIFKDNNFSDMIVSEVPKCAESPRHDQDVVNQYLETRGHLLHELDYMWNFIPSDCSSYAPLCRDCDEKGITIIHGADAVFFRNVDEKYMALYYTMEKLTRRLNIPPGVVYELLTARLEGADLLDILTICKEYKPFLQFVSHHLKDLALINEIDEKSK